MTTPIEPLAVIDAADTEVVTAAMKTIIETIQVSYG